MPSFLGCHITICSRLLRCGGDPFACLRGVLSPRGPPFLFCLVGWFGAVLPWAVLSLPSVVLVFCFLSCVAPLWLCLRSVGVSACAAMGVCPWSSCPFLWVVGPPFFCRLFGCCWLPSPADRCFPSPCGWSLLASCSSFFAGPSLWVSGCFCDGLVALPSCWGCCCALSPSLHFVSWQQRPLALCGVCFSLYTMMHVLLGCSVLPR